jgi:hypothetical protein
MTAMKIALGAEHKVGHVIHHTNPSAHLRMPPDGLPPQYVLLLQQVQSQVPILSNKDRHTIIIGHSPLHTQQAKEEGEACVPASRLVDDTIGAEDVTSWVHLMPWSSGEKANDDDCSIMSG